MKNQIQKVLNIENILLIIINIIGGSVIILCDFRIGLIYMFFSILSIIGIIIKKCRKLYSLEQLEKDLNKSFLLNGQIARNIPIALLILDEKGKILFTNNRLEEKMQISNIHGENIEEVIPTFSIAALEGSKGTQNIKFRKKHFEARYKKAKNEIGENIITLYLVDNTDLVNNKKKMIEKKISIGLIYIDNYEEVFSKSDKMEEKTLALEIEKKIYILANRLNGLLEKTDDDKYLLVFENQYIDFLESRRFDILDEVKEMAIEESMYITLSIGIGKNGENIKEAQQFAKNAMEIALGRGGDQAVVKSNDSLYFYGGKSKTKEKRTKVRARMMSESLKEIIDESQDIFIMGHSNPDLDSFGASVGVYRAVKSRDKNAYIILKGVTTSIKGIFNNLREEHDGQIDYIMTPKEAIMSMGKNSLCIVVDTHKDTHLESKEVLDKCSKTVVIDHHRRGEAFIENPILTYLESYASSACELITEILYYISDDDIGIKKSEAEALLAGIKLDTKDFSVNTGVRTFEAAVFLRRSGADPEKVRKLFRGNIEDLKLKSQVISNSKIINVMNENIAISVIEEKSENIIIIASQSADELLNVEFVKASFVVYKLEKDVYISSRSTDSINVQVIMEVFGGGGHMNAAGARIANANLEETGIDLEQAIYKYMEKGERQ